MRRTEWVILIILTFFIVALGLAYLLVRQKGTLGPTNVRRDQAVKLREENNLSEPTTSSLARITKKPFGIFVEPGKSPIAEERFVGWHTGTDFEIFQEETNNRVPVFAMCGGQLLLKKEVIGYGGVIVQNCEIEGQAVTVLYGHMDLEDPKSLGLGLEIKKEEEVGSLAMVGRFTDNERRHLHLGIHRGEAIELRGYVEQQSELSEWLNYQDLMK